MKLAKEIIHPCSKCNREPAVYSIQNDTFEFYVKCPVCGKRGRTMSTPYAAITEWNETEGRL